MTSATDVDDRLQAHSTFTIIWARSSSIVYERPTQGDISAAVLEVWMEPSHSGE